MAVETATPKTEAVAAAIATARDRRNKATSRLREINLELARLLEEKEAARKEFWDAYGELVALGERRPLE